MAVKTIVKAAKKVEGKLLKTLIGLFTIVLGSWLVLFNVQKIISDLVGNDLMVSIGIGIILIAIGTIIFIRMRKKKR